MKLRYALALLTMAVMVLAGPALAQNYVATLDGAQEVPPVPTPATGSATLNLDAAKMLHFNITYGGLIGSETAAHIHCCAPPGTNAGVLFPLPAGNPKVGSVGPLTPAQEASLNGELMYINIHTSFRPGGEIRGQITVAPIPVEPTTWSRIKRLL